jgi:phosphatidylserine decarboxylase
MSNHTYNGWTNHATWLFNVWFEPQSIADVNAAKEAIEEATDAMPDFLRDFLCTDEINWDERSEHFEETEETEYFKGKRIQISIFMSPLNVHANYFPISGITKYVKYHPGLFLVAWHPKSSTENERTTIVVEHKNGVEILFRQIAGAVATGGASAAMPTAAKAADARAHLASSE